MSTINEQIVTGRKFRKLIDEVNKIWQRISFWTKASDVEFDDGYTAETKVGAIKGITTDLNTTKTGYAADMTVFAQLYSEFQDQRNTLAALDTRVTNAITGGNLAAPFTYDVKNSSYTDNLNNAGMYDAQWSSLTTNQIKVGGGDEDPNYQGVIKGEVHLFPIVCTRTYYTLFDIKANYKLKVNLSTTTDYGSSTGYTLIMLLDSGGTILYQRQVDLGAAINEEVSLSSFNGKKVRVALKVVKSNSRQTSYVINCNIGSLVITNK